MWERVKKKPKSPVVQTRPLPFPVNGVPPLAAHLNLANGEGEAAIAVVIPDNLKLVLLTDVKHSGRLREEEEEDKGRKTRQFYFFVCVLLVFFHRSTSLPREAALGAILSTFVATRYIRR